MGIIGNKFCMKIKTFQANMRHFLFDQFKSLSL